MSLKNYIRCQEKFCKKISRQEKFFPKRKSLKQFCCQKEILALCFHLMINYRNLKFFLKFYFEKEKIFLARKTEGKEKSLARKTEGKNSEKIFLKKVKILEIFSVQRKFQKKFSVNKIETEKSYYQKSFEKNCFLPKKNSGKFQKIILSEYGKKIF